MTATSEFYRQTPVFTVIGGADFDFTITLDQVLETTLDGKTTTLQRIGRYDFTGWAYFICAMTSSDGRYTKTLSVTIDGPPDDGTLRMRGRGQQTWDLQQLGVRAGTATLLGRNPAGQKVALRNMRWTLTPGATSPSVPPVADWTVLR